MGIPPVVLELSDSESLNPISREARRAARRGNAAPRIHVDVVDLDSASDEEDDVRFSSFDAKVDKTDVGDVGFALDDNLNLSSVEVEVDVVDVGLALDNDLKFSSVEAKVDKVDKVDMGFALDEDLKFFSANAKMGRAEKDVVVLGSDSDDDMRLPSANAKVGTVERDVLDVGSDSEGYITFTSATCKYVKAEESLISQKIQVGSGKRNYSHLLGDHGTVKPVAKLAVVDLVSPGPSCTPWTTGTPPAGLDSPHEARNSKQRKIGSANELESGLFSHSAVAAEPPQALVDSAWDCWRASYGAPAGTVGAVGTGGDSLPLHLGRAESKRKLTIDLETCDDFASQESQESSAHVRGGVGASNVEPLKARGKKSVSTRKGSEDEFVSKAAQKLSEREAKKARQEEEKRTKAQQKEEEKRCRAEKKEQARREKESAKADATERRKVDKENKKWCKGKFALENTTAYLDSSLVEMKDVGSLLVGQFHTKNLTFKCVQNPVQHTILWRRNKPSIESQTDTESPDSQLDGIMNSQPSTSQLVLEDVEIKYVVVVFQASEFTKLVGNRGLHDHIVSMRELHPGYTISYQIIGLKKHLNKLEQLHFKNNGPSAPRRPNVEQALAEFVTHYTGVNSRDCLDESELAGHVTGLMESLAKFPYKPNLTALSVYSNGDHIAKGDQNKSVIMKSPWLKALIAIPKIPGAIAMAIAREYPTMRALLNAYLDPSKTENEKERLLENLVKEAVLGSANPVGRRVGQVVSKRVYRVLMAKNGNLNACDAEDGADHFSPED